MTNEQKIIDLLKSGNFTIAYHDNGYCCLYRGKYLYDELPEREDFSFDMEGAEGYAPEIVSLLAKALGGRTESA